MSNPKCLVCYAEVPNCWSWIDGAGESKSFLENHELPENLATFLLRNLLKVSPDLYAEYIKNRGNPSGRISTCSRCLVWVTEGLFINSQIKELIEKLDALSKKILEEIIGSHGASAPWPSCSSTKLQTDDSEDRCITKGARDFVFHQQKDKNISKQNRPQSAQSQYEQHNLGSNEEILATGSSGDPLSLSEEEDSESEQMARDPLSLSEEEVNSLHLPQEPSNVYIQVMDATVQQKDNVNQLNASCPLQFNQNHVINNNVIVGDNLDPTFQQQRNNPNAGPSRPNGKSMQQPFDQKHYHHCEWKGCKKSFRRYQLLQTHKRFVHFAKDDDKFVCSTSGCNLQFSDKDAVLYHEQRCSFRPHGCTWKPCEKRFRTSKLLHGHIHAVHRKLTRNIFKCSTPGCLRMYPDTQKLKIHENRCKFKFEMLRDMEIENEAANASALAVAATGEGSSADLSLETTVASVSNPTISSVSDLDGGITNEHLMNTTMTDCNIDVKPYMDISHYLKTEVDFE